MPRKKTAKGSAKRQSSNSFVDFLKMEKEFLSAPNKLIKNIESEIKVLRLAEKRIQKALNKNQSSVKITEKRMKNSTSKKQVKTAEKLRAILLRDADAMNKESNHIAKTLENFAQAQSKFVALQKHLSAFEKDWAKAAKSPTATKVKKISKPKKPTTTTATDIPHTQPYTNQENINIAEKETEEAMS